MEHYTESAGQDAKKDKKKVEKMKTSDDQSAVSGDIETGKAGGRETFEIGADRVGISQKETGIRAAIAEKEQQRDSLLKAHSEKFKEYVQKREERAATQAELLRQKMARLGEGEGLSAADQAELENYQKNDEASNAEDKRYAEGYKRDAVDLQKEIDALERELDEGN